MITVDDIHEEDLEFEGLPPELHNLEKFKDEWFSGIPTNKSCFTVLKKINGQWTSVDSVLFKMRFIFIGKTPEYITSLLLSQNMENHQKLWIDNEFRRDGCFMCHHNTTSKRCSSCGQQLCSSCGMENCDVCESVLTKLTSMTKSLSSVSIMLFLIYTCF